MKSNILQNELERMVMADCKRIISAHKSWARYKEGIPFQVLISELRDLNWKSSFNTKEFGDLLKEHGFTITDITAKTGRHMGTRINFIEQGK